MRLRLLGTGAPSRARAPSVALVVDVVVPSANAQGVDGLHGRASRLEAWVARVEDSQAGRPVTPHAAGRHRREHFAKHIHKGQRSVVRQATALPSLNDLFGTTSFDFSLC